MANPFHDSRTSVHFFTAIRHLLTCIAPRGAGGGSLISRFNKNYRPDLAPQQLDMDSNFVSSQSGDIFTAMGDVFFLDWLPRHHWLSVTKSEAVAKSRSALVVKFENYENDSSQNIFSLHFIYFHPVTTSTTTTKDNYVTPTPATTSPCWKTSVLLFRSRFSPSLGEHFYHQIHNYLVLVVNDTLVF